MNLLGLLKLHKFTIFSFLESECSPFGEFWWRLCLVTRWLCFICFSKERDEKNPSDPDGHKCICLPSEKSAAHGNIVQYCDHRGMITIVCCSSAKVRYCTKVFFKVCNWLFLQWEWDAIRCNPIWCLLVKSLLRTIFIHGLLSVPSIHHIGRWMLYWKVSWRTSRASLASLWSTRMEFPPSGASEAAKSLSHGWVTGHEGEKHATQVGREMDRSIDSLDN